MSEPRVNFDYAFAAPHMITMCRPSASQKFHLQMEENKMIVKYSYGCLKDAFPLSSSQPKIDQETELTINQDGAEYCLSGWHRHASGAPWMIAESKGEVACTVNATATATGLVIKMEFENNGSIQHDMMVHFRNMSGWVINNLGWIDGVHTNLLLTLNANGRSDRIIGYALGADEYPIFKNGRATGIFVPMVTPPPKEKGPSMMYTTARFILEPGEKKTGWFVLPYNNNLEEYEALSKADYEKEMADALAEWCDLLDESVKISICDEGVISAYRACLADLFVMREPHGGRHGISNGTIYYRSVHSGEPLIATHILDRAGYVDLVADDLPLYLEAQDDNGCWVYSKGWEHDMWGINYYKANAALQHYYITDDIEYLKAIYPRMKRSILFNRESRRSTKNDPVKAHRGMMQRGMGDCGMMDDGDFYGFFYPQDIQASAADRLILKVAQILGYEEDAKLFSEYCEETVQDLITSLRENSIKEDGYEWIPAVPGSNNTSMFGCLYAFHPGKILDAQDPLIQGTIRHVLSEKISEGGLPMGTGWMPKGIWVAMALDNFSSMYLRMGERDKASDFLYPVLNHATPLVTWCEERGQEKGSKETSGDFQHLWTPVSVCGYMLDALLYEDDNAIHICEGIPRHWLAEGKRICVSGLRTRCGKADFTVENKGGKLIYDIRFEREVDRDVYLCFRTPDRDEPVKLTALKGELE